ncbi:MAG TPA: acetate--CoA ligase family protein [Candidatus Dormibacteraeota bacterium]|nr:acetate--CoA ligase family protein [Candidatus Dormibacteraeota bacterium]
MNRSLSAILRPRSIAVVGASRHPQSIGREILHNLVRSGFTGPIFPVNPNAASVHSIKCYPGLRDIPDPVDLAVIVVPKEIVPRVVEDAIAKQVRGLVVITAGFKEVGEEGERAERALRDRIRPAGIRMVGPNCMGVINTDPEIRMNATFAATRPEPGSVGFMSQSGALGEVILAHAHDIGLGIAYFVSMGNKADISGNDLIEAWEDDARVNVILMYLESFGNPARFLSIARRVTRVKPILAVKSGRTASGARAAFSHTGALAGAGAAYDTLLDQAGVIRVESMSEMFTLATAFAHERLPKGNRVGILTNAGGPAIMATDACATLGLEVVELSAAAQAALRRVLVPEASVRNPVDMVAAADATSYAAALGVLKDDRGLDGLIVIFVSPIMINAVEVARAIVAAARGARLPILTCFMGKEQGKQGVEELRRAGIPVYLFPEEAAHAMAGLERYRRMRERPEGTRRTFQADQAAAAAVLTRAATAGRSVLPPEEIERLLKAYGLPLAPSKMAADEKQAASAAAQIGFPVVVKGVAESLVHKTEAGAVRLDLRSAPEVEEACVAMRRALRQPDLRFQVQAMVRGGRETILGFARDPKLGAMLMFGLGGIFVEVMHDVVFRILPVTDVEARDMVRGIKGHPLLAGARGGPKADEDFLVEALLRLGQMAADHPEIEQVDINPLLAGPDRASSFVVDARARLAAR